MNTTRTPGPLAALVLLFSTAASATPQAVDFKALGQEFLQEHCTELSGDETCTLEHVLQASYAHVRLGAFELHHPVSFFKDGERRAEFQEIALGLLDFQRSWLAWLMAGDEGFAAASADLDVVHEWVDGWKLKTLASMTKLGAPRDVAALFEAKPEVRASEERVFALFHDVERLGLGILRPEAVQITLAPSRRDFVHWLGFAGLIDPEKQQEYWGEGTHEWTQIWSGWTLLLALEYSPWTGFDPTFKTSKSMKSFEDSGLVEHVALQSGMALLRYCLERPLDHLDNAFVMNTVIDFVGQVNTIDGEGQISRSGARTSPYSRFVPGGLSEGGRLPAMSAARFDSLVKNQWRKSNGEDHFLKALKQGQKDGVKQAKKDKHPRKEDDLAHFLLRADAQKYVVSAPFFGPHAAAQAYPPGAFLIDYREFYRAYKSAFAHWLRTRGVPDSEEESAAKFAQILRGLDELDFESRGFDELLLEIYGVPFSAADGASDSLEWRFLSLVKKGR